MAAMTRVALVVASLAGCSDLSGFGGAVPALVTVHVQTTGELASVRPPGSPDPKLRVALVWGAQWLPEPLCILPPDDATVTALIAAGCRDPFGFVPDRVAADAPLASDGTASIGLLDLPAADVMVGDVTARVAYGSLVVYDDRDGNATLTLGLPSRLGGRQGPMEGDSGTQTLDVVYGASFVSMTEPDARLAFREGGFNQAAAFYPRSGCGDPLASFSIVSAGGFTAAAAVAAQAQGQLPPEDPATCSEASPETPVAVAFRRPAQVHELACEERLTDSSVRYREPPADPPDLAVRTYACPKIPDFGTGMANGRTELAISGRSDESCVGLSHYVLRGCRNDPLCALPAWDITATPPSWWPCPAQAAQ